jgi:hypothetical protein
VLTLLPCAVVWCGVLWCGVAAESGDSDDSEARAAAAAARREPLPALEDTGDGWEAEGPDEVERVLGHRCGSRAYGTCLQCQKLAVGSCTQGWACGMVCCGQGVLAGQHLAGVMLRVGSIA